MKRIVILNICAAALAAGFLAEPAAAGPKHKVWDRIEDRIDRRESYLDRQVDYGRRDRIEDRIDRWEDRRDRQGKPTPRFVRKWERKSWKRRWGGS